MSRIIIHSISLHEWLAGFSLVLDVFILVILAGYLIHQRSEMFQSHYCVATGMLVYMAGHSLRMWVTWYNLFTHPELNTHALIEAKFPLVGSPLWVIGSLIAAIGLAKLIKTFGNGYINKWLWVVAIAAAILLPLASLWI